MSQAVELATLQEIDNEAAAARAALADVQQRLEGDAELDEARRRLIQAEASSSAVAADQRRIDSEVERLNDKIVPEEKRLYDGSVSSPKELTNIQHEVDLLKVTRAAREDDLVAVLERAEAAERERAEAAKEVARLESRWAKQQTELKREARRLTDAIARAEQKRNSQKALVPPRQLQTYEELRRRKGGMAVARLQGGTCSGCRIGVPDAVRTRALAGAVLAQCPNCERILVVG